MNSTAEAIDFECPKGFSKEDVQSQLYFEDIDDDSELWLIRMPSDMDPTVLENQRISLDKSSEILGGNDGKFYEYFTEKCAMPNLCLVVPHKESKTLEELKKPFKGSILVTDYMLVDTDTSVKMEVEESGMEKENNEQQNEDTSVRKKSKSHKSSKEGKDKEDMELSFNLNLEDNHENNSSLEKPSKKSKKKKSKDLDILKVEPMSDADEFPNCKSQKT